MIKKENFISKIRKKKSEIKYSSIKTKLNYYNKKIKNLEEKLICKDKKIDFFLKKINDLEKNIYDLNLRNIADIDNIRKRTQDDIEKIHKYSLKKVFIDLLPVIDNLKSALEISKKKDINIKVTTKGIYLTLKILLSVINKFGISIINKKNVNFNTDYHQAMFIEKTLDKNLDNKIIDILQDGYILNGILLRPAMVKVLKYKE